MKEMGDSVYEKMKVHDEVLNIHGERIDGLEKVTAALVETDKQHEEKLKQLEDQSMKLENTVMSESRETRRTFTENVDRLFDIVNTSIAYKETSEKQEHELRMAKLNTWSTVVMKVSGGIAALLSSGGILYYVITQLLK